MFDGLESLAQELEAELDDLSRVVAEAKQLNQEETDQHIAEHGIHNEASLLEVTPRTEDTPLDVRTSVSQPSEPSTHTPSSSSSSSRSGKALVSSSSPAAAPSSSSSVSGASSSRSSRRKKRSSRSKRSQAAGGKKSRGASKKGKSRRKRYPFLGLLASSTVLHCSLF
jgi:hypothetical protein